MLIGFDDVVLKTGESVSAVAICGPDDEWAPRLKPLLAHKGQTWQWQIEQFLAHRINLEGWFYVLHRNGEPFSNIMTAEVEGVGIYGHVYTVPEDRRKGAATLLQQKLMAHFQERGGRALFLGTGFDTPPFHIYLQAGFEGIEPASGLMTYYRSGDETGFLANYCGPGPTRIEPLGWEHWPTAAPLLLGPWPGVVRSAPLGAIGRVSSEGVLLQPLADSDARQQAGDPPRVLLLVKTGTLGVVAVAAWTWHPIWPRQCIVDIYCHPDHWDRGNELLDALSLPDAEGYIAYGDSVCPHKHQVLKHAAYRQVASVADRLAVDTANTGRAGLVVFEKK